MVEIDNQKAGNCKVMETNTVDYYKLPLITVKLPETCEGTSPKILIEGNLVRQVICSKQR